MEKDELHKMFIYDEIEGGLYWKQKGCGRTIGRRFGMHDGYRKGYIQGKSYREHTLVWIYHNGDIPFGLEIDHKNQVRDDNRIENLRVVTHAQNMANKKAAKKNKLNVKGVSKTGNRYRATFCGNYKSFFTLKEAADFYDKLAFAKYGEFAYLNNL
jgi:phosphotransferase system IIB component